MDQQNELGFPLIDYFHVHLEGELTLEKALALSRERNVRFGIVEHGGFGCALGDDQELLRYIEQLADYSVYKGIQAEGRDWPDCFSWEAINQLDYVLTDALTFPDRDGVLIRLWTPEVRIKDPEDFMERYVGFHVRILSQEPIDIMANPTFLPWCLADDYEVLWTEDRMDRVIQAAVEHSVALEVNAQYRVPSVDFVRRAKRAGARFAFGSNYHSEEVGRLEYGLQVAGECHLQRDDLFWP